MSEAGNAVKNPTAGKPAAPETGANRVAELKVSGHLMTLDTGIFCIFHAPGGVMMDDGTGLPGVRISLPPAPAGRPDAVRISTFRQDGWLDFFDGAALVRVDRGPAQVLVTVYQSPSAPAETAPRLQVLRLTPDGAPVARPAAGPAAGAAAGPVAAGPAAPAQAGRTDVVAHIQRSGDTGGAFGSWVGTRGSGAWIEGFALNPPEDLTADDLEYQAVLGRGWLSPWIEGGKFCGSRGMALPLLGLNVRLKGDAAKTHECSYHATFVDGSSVGPVPAGEACQSDSLAALEAFQVVLRRRGAAAGVAAPKPAAAAPVAKSAPVPHVAARPVPVPHAAPRLGAAKPPPAKKGAPVKAAASRPAAGRAKAKAPAKAPAGRGGHPAPRRSR